MSKCQVMHVPWRILPDRHGADLASDRHLWYQKAPETVTSSEKPTIIQAWGGALSAYYKVWFYVRPDSFHPFYGRVLQRSALSGRI